MGRVSWWPASLPYAGVPALPMCCLPTAWPEDSSSAWAVYCGKHALSSTLARGLAVGAGDDNRKRQQAGNAALRSPPRPVAGRPRLRRNKIYGSEGKSA